LSVSETVKKIIEITNYNEYLMSLDIDSKLDNVNELINAIEQFEKNSPTPVTIKNYLDEISLYTEATDDTDQKNNTVSLMTVHVAKGLEFKVVFIIGLNEGIFPSIHNGEISNLEEERRIAYVAMTRAKKQLFLSYSGGYSYLTGGPLEPSRFINEINPKLLNIESIYKYQSNNDSDLDYYNSLNSNYENNYIKQNYEFNIGDQVVHTVFKEGFVIGIKGDELEILFKAPYGKKTIVKNHKSLKYIKN